MGNVLLFTILLFVLVPSVSAYILNDSVTISWFDASGIKNVSFILITPSGEIQEYPMHDDGEHDDGKAGDSLYGVYFNVSEEGEYRYKSRAYDNFGRLGESNWSNFSHYHIDLHSVMKTWTYFGQELWETELVINNPEKNVFFNFEFVVEKPARNFKINFDGEPIANIWEREDATKLYFLSDINLHSGQHSLQYSYEKDGIFPSPSIYILPAFEQKIAKFPFDEYTVLRPLPTCGCNEFSTSQKIVIEEIQTPYKLDDKSGLLIKPDLFVPFDFVDGKYVLVNDQPDRASESLIILNIKPPVSYLFPPIIGGVSLLILLVIRVIPIERIKQLSSIFFDIVPILKNRPGEFYWFKAGTVSLIAFQFIKTIINAENPITIPIQDLKVNFTLLNFETWFLIVLIYTFALTSIEYVYSKVKKNYKNLFWAFSLNDDLRDIIFEKYQGKPNYLKDLDQLFLELKEYGCEGIREKIKDANKNLSKFDSIRSEFEIGKAIMKKGRKIKFLPDDFLDSRSPDILTLDKEYSAYIEVKRITENELWTEIIQFLSEFLKDRPYRVDVKVNKDLAMPAVDFKARDEQKKILDITLSQFSKLFNKTTNETDFKITTETGVIFEFHRTELKKGYPGIITSEFFKVPEEILEKKIAFDLIEKAKKRDDWADEDRKRHFIIAIDSKEWTIDDITVRNLLYGDRTSIGGQTSQEKAIRENMWKEILRNRQVKIPKWVKIEDAKKRNWETLLMKEALIPNNYTYLSDEGLFSSEPMMENVSAVILKSNKEIYFFPNPFASNEINDSSIINYMTQREH